MARNDSSKPNINYQDVDSDNFDDFLCIYHGGDLLKGVYGYGFERPSPIQAKSIPPICDGRDLIAQAQSGSGKTGAFVIGSLTKIDVTDRRPQAMMVSPTRELATQHESVVKEIGKYISTDVIVGNDEKKVNLKISLCIGGKDLTEGPIRKDANYNLREASDSHVLIGTPGRLVDIIGKSEKKGRHLLDGLKILVLDEADKLLEDGFREQLKDIMMLIPKNCQVCLFSATYPQEVLDLTTYFLKDPIKILIEKEKISVDVIKNFYIDVGYEDNKYTKLTDLYQKVTVCQAVIFVNTVRKANDLSDNLRRDGHSVGTIHSKMTDSQRSEILANFRRSQTRILVATDIISRGIDVQQVGLVINYDVPNDPEQYIHRVGRSGRYGKLGVAITFVTTYRSDIEKMQNIERTYRIRFNELPSTTVVNNYLTGLHGFNPIDSSHTQN